MAISWIVCGFGVTLILSGYCYCEVQNDRLLADELRLYDVIITNDTRHRYVRPVLRGNESVHVEISLALFGLEDLDEKRQVMTSHVWLRQRWHNPYTRWEPAEYGGLTNIMIPATQIWTPDIVPHNSLSDSYSPHHDSMAVISSSGLIFWITQSRLETFCYLDMTNFPLDQHTCSIKYGSWAYDAAKVNISHWGDPEFDLDYGSANQHSGWHIMNASVKIHTQIYGCCPEPYQDITAYVTLSRRHSYVVQTHVAPAITFVLLTPAVFMLPSESPHKFILGSGLLIAQVFLLSALSDVVPSAHHTPPRLGLYYICILVLVSLSMGVSALVINIWNRSRRRSYGVPGCVRVMLLKGLGRLLCLHYEDFLCVDMSHDHAFDHYASNLDTISQVSSNNPQDDAKMIREYNSHVVHRAEWRQLAAIIDRTFCIVFWVMAILIAVAILIQF